LSIAIGKKGQNVRLASKLTGWHLDVKSETKYSQAMQTGYDTLIALPGIGISLADALYEQGFFSAEEVSRATIEELTQIRGIGPEKAAKLIEAAKLATSLERPAVEQAPEGAGAEASEADDAAEAAPASAENPPGKEADQDSLG